VLTITDGDVAGTYEVQAAVLDGKFWRIGLRNQHTGETVAI